jgi:hypothetical protein
VFLPVTADRVGARATLAQRARYKNSRNAKQKRLLAAQRVCKIAQRRRMSALSDTERRLVRDAIAQFVEQKRHNEAHFYYIIPWLAVMRRHSLAPRVSEQALQRVSELVMSSNFSVGAAARCFEIIRDDVAKPYHKLPAIVVNSCPLVEQDPNSDSTCEKDSASPGCDACAGRYYFAKTDGNQVWMAAKLFTDAYKNGGAEQLTVGDVSVPSMTEFVILHETAHVLESLVSHKFDALTKMYEEALSLVPRELLESGRIYSSDDGAREFAANAFAYENARTDRQQRTDFMQ